MKLIETILASFTGTIIGRIIYEFYETHKTHKGEGKESSWIKK